MKKILENRIKGKTLIIGVGNTLRGDDGLGPILVQQLMGKVEADLLDTGEVPESYLGRIINSNPDTIVVIDAVQLQEYPGTMAVIEINEMLDISCSTHRLSLGLFLKYVQEQTRSDVFLVGVQPGTIDLGQEITPQVQDSLDVLKDYFTMIL